MVGLSGMHVGSGVGQSLGTGQLPCMLGHGSGMVAQILRGPRP